MKALVIGASGQVGSALLGQVPPGIKATGLSRDVLDLTDETAIAEAIFDHRPDFVLNAAAYTAVDKAESEPELAQAINGDAVGAMAMALLETGGRLVHISTDFVFDGEQSTPYAPDDQRNPLSAYGETKAAGEDVAGDDAIICRTSWVYAAGGANFVRTMLRLMGERDELSVVADQIGAPTWASGLARTLWALALEGQPGTYHHRDAGAASWYDLAVAIYEEGRAIGLLSRDVAISPIATEDYPAPAHRPAYSLLDDSETRALLGDRPPHWRVNLRKMLQEEQRLG